MAETTIYAEEDGGLTYAEGVEADLATIYTEAGESLQTGTGQKVGLNRLDWGGGNWHIEVGELFMAFDLSSIAAGSTVNSSTMKMMQGAWNTGSGTMELYKYDWSSGGCTTADHRTQSALGSLYSGSPGLLATLVDPGYSGTSDREVTWTSESAFTSALDLGATTYLVMSAYNHRNGTTPYSENSIYVYTPYHATASYRPRLVIDYSPPAGFTGLTVTRVLNG